MPESAIFSFFIGHIFQNILHPAVQDLAERIQRGGRHGLSVLHAVEKAGIYTLLEDQVVFSYALSKERLIKRLIADHLIHRVKITGYIDYTSYMLYNEIVDNQAACRLSK